MKDKGSKETSSNTGCATLGRKKVLHVVEAFGGGVFSSVSALIKYTHEAYETVVFYSERPQTPKNFKSFFPKDVKLVESQYMARDLRLLRDINAMRELKGLIRQECPDVVHLHSSKAGAIGRIACIGEKTKVLYSPRGFSFLMEDAPKIKRFVFFCMEKMLAWLPGTIVGCSAGEYTEARKVSKKCIQINNGVDLEELVDAPFHAIGNASTICTVGRICYQKNPKLFNAIAKDNPNYRFVWIGDGEKKDELTAGNIEITGWLSRKETLKRMQSADIFILTSLWEGLPISLLEAMYMRKLCIVSNSIGNRDVIVHGKNGFIADDVSAFSKIIQNIKKIDVRAIVERSHNDVCDLYGMDTTAKNFLREYAG